MQTNKMETDEETAAYVAPAARRVSHQPSEVSSAMPVLPLSPDSNRVSAANPAHHIDDFLEEDVRPHKLDRILEAEEPNQQLMEKHAWNPDDRSLNIYVKEDDPLTLHRLPVSQSTDSIRGRVGYAHGFHVWAIHWPLRQRGTHAVVGVATKEQPLHAVGYSSLVGSTEESWGWDLIRNEALHNSKETNNWKYPEVEVVGDGFVAPETIYCILDMDMGTLAFATNDEYLGVAFRGLRGLVLYPAVSVVWGHSEITTRYLGSLHPEPRPLMEICRRNIRLQVGAEGIDGVNELPLPLPLKDFVLFRPRHLM